MSKLGIGFGVVDVGPEVVSSGGPLVVSAFMAGGVGGSGVGVRVVGRVWVVVVVVVVGLGVLVVGAAVVLVVTVVPSSSSVSPSSPVSLLSLPGR